MYAHVLARRRTTCRHLPHTYAGSPAFLPCRAMGKAGRTTKTAGTSQVMASGRWSRGAEARSGVARITLCCSTRSVLVTESKRARERERARVSHACAHQLTMYMRTHCHPLLSSRCLKPASNSIADLYLCAYVDSRVRTRTSCVCTRTYTT